MTQRREIQHQFVQFIPSQLAPDLLYVSIEFATASHLCMCGCGHEVVTPISPTDWTLAYDGATVSLRPSIGNWSYACQSHYFITRNRVRWVPKMSDKAIERGRERDRLAKEHEYTRGVQDALDSASIEDRAEAPGPVQLDSSPPNKRTFRFGQRRKKQT